MGIDVEQLKKVSLFRDLPMEDMQAIASLAVSRQYPRNTLVICEGDESDSLYIVLSGKVKVYLSDDEGKDVTLNIQGEGEYFGELALLDGGTRSASVVTQQGTRLAVISRKVFDRCLEDNPKIALTVMRGLARRLRELSENVRSLALMDVYGRVAHTLLDLAKEEGGKMVIPQRLTQQEIASMVGASREMVSRILRDLSAGGYISIKNKIIPIHGRLPASW